MRLILVFDLPTDTAKERRAYRVFRKKLLNEGFAMVQFSVYTKVALNPTQKEAIVNKVRLFCPPSGDIGIITLTEKQYHQINWLNGKNKNNMLQGPERYHVI